MLSLGNRMKTYYEDINRNKLLRRVPVIARIDGRAFHTFTKNKVFLKPFSDILRLAICYTTNMLCSKVIQGAKFGYTQSDEISILITDYDKLTTSAFFDYNIQKLCSVIASEATIYFNKQLMELLKNTGYNEEYKWAAFDCRVFNIPKEEFINYFIWRQLDWERNSVQMLARNYYSHKELLNKNTSELHEMIYQKGDNWASLESYWKNGTFVLKDGDLWKYNSGVIAKKDRKFLEQLTEPNEE